MPKIRIFSLVFFVGVGVILVAQLSSAQTTVAVGSCRRYLVSYSTISEAVAAVTPNSTVLVCPGAYPEQVTITQALTLKGLKGGTGAYPVITVPSGGVVLNDDGIAAQMYAKARTSSLFSVAISNLIVDGAGSGFDCSAGYPFEGIVYSQVAGSLINVTVRNQNPGGCGYGIILYGNENGGPGNTVNVRNSNIHGFDDIGIFAQDSGGTFWVNLFSNSIVSTSTAVQAGVQYTYYTVGVANHNNVVLAGGVGLYLGAAAGGRVTARYNTITGSNVGISSGLSGHPIVEWNTIIQSATAAIELGCLGGVIVKYNTISDAPIGIANITSGDVVKLNTFIDVTNPTTTCP